jgi:hypothetical protein
MSDLKFSSPNVRVEIDGKVTTLRLTIDALSKLQEIWGLSDMQALQERLGAMQPKDMGDLLYCAMLHDQPNATAKDGKAFANSLALPDLLTVVTRVVQASRPPAGAAAPNP